MATTVNPTGAPILPGQNLDNPQTPVTVPVTAPPATATTPTPTTSTTPTPSKPTAVVSSDQGQAHYDQATNTMKSAQLDIDRATATRLANAGKPGYDFQGYPVGQSYTETPGPNGPVKTDTGTTTEPSTLNEPDSGNQFIWDSQGNRTQIGVNEPVPVGYTKVNPLTGPTTPVTSSASLPSGTTIKQFSDGTYGSFNATGAYIGASTADQFQTAQDAQSIQSSWSKVLNGTYPLTAAQQGQISSIQSIYADLIKQQETANANLTGGVTVAQNLYGMGNSIVGLGAIKASVDEGIAKIAELQNKLVDNVNGMIAADNKDNYALVKEAYDSYTANAKTLQDTFDKMQTSAQKEADKIKAGVLADNQAAIKKYPDAGILETDTAAQRMAKLKTDPKFTQDTTVAAALNPDETKFWADMAQTGVSMSSILPNLGIGAAAAQQKIAIMKQIAANAKNLGLSAQDVANSMLDKSSKAKTITKLQQQGSQLAAQEASVEQDFNLVKSLGKKVPDQILQTGIPFLQNWINTGTLQATGNPDLNNYLKNLTVTLTKYARVAAGQTGSGATTAQMNTEVQSLINGNFSVDAVNSFIDKSAIPEMKNTVSGYDTTMKQLTGDMNQADGTTNATVTEGGLGVGGGNSNSGGSDPAGLGI